MSVVYYRYGYDPRHFISDETKLWKIFSLVESSRAIKVPSLRYHLAGMKCFQLVLNNDEFLEKIFPTENSFRNDLKEITEEMFTIDQMIEDSTLQRRIVDEPTSFYLKQNREGGQSIRFIDETFFGDFSSIF